MPGSGCRNRAGTCRTTGAGDRDEGDEGDADGAGDEGEADGAGEDVQPATAMTTPSVATTHRSRPGVARAEAADRGARLVGRPSAAEVTAR